MKDTVAPKINISKSIEGKWITAQKSVSLIISDEFSGVKSYNGYLNDVWVLFEYESKLNKITHVFKDNLLLEGANKLKVVVTDNVGNSSIFETQFNRSQK
jgi:C4-type Zn-finger protein